ncbi:MAG: exo-alpha-sialidase, partial [Hydrococcus sp. CSU_1_8]|nr:exo-alpha-sialidase [Hydrococcus sp. CSU_1_8]
MVWLIRPEPGQNDRQIFYAQAPAKAKGKMSWTKPLLLAGGVPGFARVTPEQRLWQEHPVIHATPQGHLAVVWEGKDDAHPVKAQIKVTYSRDDGATWSQWQNIPGEPNSYYSRPTIVSTADGKIIYVVAYATRRDQEDTHLVWTQLALGNNQLGDDWQAWQYVTEQTSTAPCSGQQDQRQVSLVIDGADRLHAVWQQPASADVIATQICYAQLANGRWGKPQLLAANPKVYQSFPNITVDKDNRLWAVWNEFDPSTGRFSRGDAGRR